MVRFMASFHFTLRAAIPALVPLLLGLVPALSSHTPRTCDPDNGGLVLPKGACATVVASGIGAVRQLAVAPHGDLYAAIASGGKGVLALRDTNGDGKPDQRASF